GAESYIRLAKEIIERTAFSSQPAALGETFTSESTEVTEEVALEDAAEPPAMAQADTSVNEMPPDEAVNAASATEASASPVSQEQVEEQAETKVEEMPKAAEEMDKSA